MNSMVQNYKKSCVVACGDKIHKSHSKMQNSQIGKFINGMFKKPEIIIKLHTY